MFSFSAGFVAIYQNGFAAQTKERGSSEREREWKREGAASSAAFDIFFCN